MPTELGVHPDTVRKAIEAERFHSTQPLRSSIVDPYVPFLRQTLEQYPDLRATRIYQMIRDRGYSGSVVQLRRSVARLRPHSREPFLQLHAFPGEQAQVDWAHFGHVMVGRARRALSCFVITLSYSRALYLEFFFDQTMENFLRGHVHAFQAWSGQPRVILYDNLKSAVLERRGNQILFHPRLIELSAHYHFAPRPCQVRAGNQKGRVERAIRYVRDSFWAGRTFTTLAECNRQALLWRDQVAHQRRWPGGDHRTVGEAFAEEQPRLLPPALHSFSTDRIETVCSHKTIYVRFDLNELLHPARSRGQPLTLLASDTSVRILDGSIEIARHIRTYDRHQLVLDPVHQDAVLKIKRKAFHSTPGRPSGASRAGEQDAVGPGLRARRIGRHSDSSTDEVAGRVWRRLHCAAPSLKLCNATRRARPPSLSCCDVSRAPHWWRSTSATIRRPNRSTSAHMIWRLTMNSPAPKTTPTKTTATTPGNSLSAQLQQIGLCAVPAQLDDFIARATKARWSAHQILEQLVKAEAAERSRRSLERRLRISGIKSFKPMADFDWSWPAKIERDVIERALTLDFLGEARNLVLVGRNGLGKTMIAQNICHTAVLAGHSVLFRSAAALLEDLHRQSPEGRRRKLRTYANVGLLCIDEVGYLSFDDKAADLLYEVVNRRYERKPVILTTNRPFKEWNEVFPNATCIVTLLDRLLHHAEVTVIEGDSYRVRESEQETAARRRKK